jgi:peptidoglycan hydrolase-like protein with peptidoglycan-binding domain
MAASMFSLGDIYEQGDGGTKDPSAALAWFAITGEFERQTNRDGESPLARTAAQRAQVLKRTLTTAELERAQALAQGEFKRIVADLSPPPAPVVASQPPAQIAPIDDTVLAWPKAAGDQVRAIQQALLDLKRIRDKPDGNLGPNTRTAIRDFQKSVGMKPTGEPSRDLYLALVSARHDIVSDSPLPTPPAPKVEPAKPQPVAAALAQPLNDTKIDLGRTDPPPPPPRSVDIAAAAPPAAKPPVADPPKPPPVVVDTTKPVPSKVETTQPSPAPADIATPPAPPPPTSADIAQAGPPKVEIAKVEIAKPDPNAWPAGRLDQVKAIQTLLRDLRFYNKAIDGQASGGTQAAIRDYQHMAGLKETGEADKALFESLKDMRKLMTPARN